MVFSFIKSGVQELAIARPEESKGSAIYKHPDKTIPMKAQLTVQADELALFFKDGAYVGQFPPGRHTLDTDVIPFLGQIIDRFTGGDVFRAEVYFVNTREMAGLKFGGPVGRLRDPLSGLLAQLMVHGTYSLKVIDPRTLVISLVGMGRDEDNKFFDWFRQQVTKTLKDDIATLIVKKKWPLTDVTSGAYTEELETEALQGVRRHVEEYGIEVMRFGDFHIAMNKEDEERLNKFFKDASYIQMAGGMQGYQQFAQANMMMNAGEGMKKGGGDGGAAGGALAGAGIGLGFGMAGHMMNQGMFGHGHAHAPPGYAPPQHNAPPTGMSGSGQNTMTCGSCNAQVPPGKFCAQCGGQLAAPGPKFCPNCGTQAAGKFCGNCGQQVHA
jgi:membrane protease subunit (stomatin/prohibitin family)